MRLPYRRTSLWTGVAVLGAVCTFVSFHRYVGWLRSQIPAGGLVPVVVAARDIEAGQVVGPGVLRTALVPAGVVPKGALRSVRSAVGSAATVFVEEGQTVTARTIGREGPSALLPRGMRAYDLPADFGSGSLVPRQGDRVDVIATFPGDATGEATTRTVLSGTTVAGFASGGGGSDSMGAGSGFGEAGSGSSGRITLLVTPEEAERLAMAESFGRIRVVLASVLP
jgi:Flp pilus assembly protein CpaB